MHNGQVGGFETFRRSADMLIPDALCCHRKGATDSEVVFLLALAERLETHPKQALERAVGQLEQMSRERGTTPHFRMSAAFSDGETLYAVRYASDAFAPTVYHRWSNSHGGRAVVSEPVEADETDWIAVPPSSFCTFTNDGETSTEAFKPLS